MFKFLLFFRIKIQLIQNHFIQITPINKNGRCQDPIANREGTKSEEGCRQIRPERSQIRRQVQVAESRRWGQEQEAGPEVHHRVQEPGGGRHHEDPSICTVLNFNILN